MSVFALFRKTFRRKGDAPEAGRPVIGREFNTNAAERKEMVLHDECQLKKNDKNRKVGNSERAKISLRKGQTETQTTMH